MICGDIPTGIERPVEVYKMYRLFKYGFSPFPPSGGISTPCPVLRDDGEEVEA